MSLSPPMSVSTQAVLGDPLFDLPQPPLVPRDLSTPQLTVLTETLLQRLLLAEQRIVQLDYAVADLQAHRPSAYWHRFVCWLRGVFVGR